MSGMSPKEVVTQFLNFMASGDPADTEKAGALFSQDASFWIIGNLPISGTLVGRDEIMKKRFRPGGSRVVPGSKSLQIGKVIAEGEFVAAEWTSRRKVVNAPDYANTFFGLFQVRGGEILMLREYMDTLAVKEAGWYHVAPGTQPAAAKG
jgi:uncharacterized protein